MRKQAIRDLAALIHFRKEGYTRKAVEAWFPEDHPVRMEFLAHGSHGVQRFVNEQADAAIAELDKGEEKVLSDEEMDTIDKALFAAAEVLPYAKDDPADPSKTTREELSSGRWIASVNGVIDAVNDARRITDLMNVYPPRSVVQPKGEEAGGRPYTTKELRLLPGQCWIMRGDKRVLDDSFDTGQALRLVRAFNEAQVSGGQPELVERAINDEPEFPTAMPDQIWEVCRNDKEGMQEAFRLAVRLTKEGIRTRLQALLYSEGRSCSSPLGVSLRAGLSTGSVGEDTDPASRVATIPDAEERCGCGEQLHPENETGLCWNCRNEGNL